MKWGIAVLLVLWFQWCSAFGDDREQLIGYLEAHSANWRSVGQMDVLCRTDVLQEPSIVEGYTETVFERIILDWEHHRFAYIKSGSRRSLVDAPSSETLESGFIVDQNYVRTFGPRRRDQAPQPVASIEKLFDDQGVPDLRLLMFMKLGRGSGRPWATKKWDSFQTLPRLADTVRVKAGPPGQIRLELYTANGAGYHWNFDTLELVPTEAVWKFDGPGEDSPPIVVGSEFFRWERRSNVSVPVSVEGQFRRRDFRIPVEQLVKLTPAELTPERLTEIIVDSITHRDMRFKWFSVNQPLQDEFFRFSLLDSPADFFSLADPKTVGATELTDEFVDQTK